MNAKENRRSIIVGLFVFLGLVILVAGILALGNQQSRFAKTATVTTYFEDVSGLKAGSNIWFSGVKVGTVKQINFKGLDLVEIVMNIENRSREYIRKDAVAKIGSDGFIGNKLILIEGGSANVAPVENGDELVSSSAASTEELLSTLQVNNLNLVGITENLKTLSDMLVQGNGTVSTLLRDTIVSHQIIEMMRNLNLTTQNTAKASAAINVMAENLNQQGSLLNELMTDTVVYSELKTAVAQLNGITQTAQDLVSNLNQTTEKLNSEDNVISLLLNDPEMANTLKQTMENLESSTEKLDQNMEALQHNFLFRGYFRRQAKNQDN